MVAAFARLCEPTRPVMHNGVGYVQGGTNRCPDRLSIERIDTPGAQEDGGGTERSGVTKDGADIVRITHLLENQDRLHKRHIRQQLAYVDRLWTLGEAKAALVKVVAADLTDH